jgi:hypothetical protein
MLVGLPMRWSLSPYHLCDEFTDTFVRHLRQLKRTHHENGHPKHLDGSVPNKRHIIHTRWKCAKILPYVKDFLLFAATRKLALALRQQVIDHLLTSLGLLRHPIKRLWEPTQTRHHLGSDIDTANSYYPLAAIFQKHSKQARQPLQRSIQTRICLPVKDLQSFASQAECLFLAIPADIFFLRDLHSVLGEKWGRRVRLIPQLRRDLESGIHMYSVTPMAQ